MIIQCEKCKTKFRLDDSRVTDKGVKVRCTKCKHVFRVQKEVVETGALAGLPDAVAPDEDYTFAADQTPDTAFDSDGFDATAFQGEQADTRAAESLQYDDSTISFESDDLPAPDTNNVQGLLKNCRSRAMESIFQVLISVTAL